MMKFGALTVLVLQAVKIFSYKKDGGWQPFIKKFFFKMPFLCIHNDKCGKNAQQKYRYNIYDVKSTNFQLLIYLLHFLKI